MLRRRRLWALSGLGFAFALASAAHGSAGATGLANSDWTDARGLRLITTAPAEHLVPDDASFDTPGRRDQLGDIAFWGNTAVLFDGQLGPASGFRVIDVSDPAHPQALGIENRLGNTTHIAIWRHLVIISVDDHSAGYDDPDACNSEEGINRFVGLMIYSIENPSEPKCLGQLATGGDTAHTFTVLPDLENDRLLAYVTKGLHVISEKSTIDLVQIPLDDPGNLEELRSISIAPLEGNHDMTVFWPLKRAVVLDPVLGFVLWDLSNPEEPRTIGVVRTNAHASANVNNNHSAAFSWDGKYLVVGEEPAGALAAPPTDGTLIGRLRFYSVVQIIKEYQLKYSAGDGIARLGDYNVTEPVSTYAIPAERADAELPFMPHQFNVLPIRPDNKAGTPAERILTIGWMRGGTSLVDFTDPREPKEVGHWVARDVEHLENGVHSNAYASLWYRDHIYATNIAEDGFLPQYFSGNFNSAKLESNRPSRGLDVLTLAPDHGYAWAQRVAHLPRLNYSLQEGHGLPRLQRVVTNTDSSGTPVLHAVVRNTGYAVTPATRITFALDGQMLGEARTPTLDPGHSATVSLPWSPPTDATRHLLTVSTASQTAAGGGQTVDVAVYGDRTEG